MMQPRCNTWRRTSRHVEDPIARRRAAGRANVPGVPGGAETLRASTRSPCCSPTLWPPPPRGPPGRGRVRSLRAEHDDLTIATIEALNGTMVKHTGDGAMALFVGAGDALACATRLQQLLERRNRGAVEKIEIRAGLSMGDVVIEADDVQGIAVVEARRLCDAAGTGHVLCSDLVRAASGTRGGHRFGPVTERELKGWARPSHRASWCGPRAPPTASRRLPGVRPARRRARRNRPAARRPQGAGGARRTRRQ